MSEYDHTVTINVPDWMWPDAKSILRLVRVKLRDDFGASSRVRRYRGGRTTVELSGHPEVVATGARCVARIGKMADQYLERYGSVADDPMGRDLLHKALSQIRNDYGSLPR
jgi:ribosomal protein S19E (S16A)